jgi:hypothetical protein
MVAVMKEVFSSNVDQIGYDEDTSELTVVWKGGKTSIYSGVPQSVAEQTMNDWSVGKAINANIKPAYAHRYA